MNFDEALQSANLGANSTDYGVEQSTTSKEGKGVPKKVGRRVVRRPIPSGYITTKYYDDDDEENNDEEEKDGSKKDEGRRIDRNTRPTYGDYWSRDFWYPETKSKKKKPNKKKKKSDEKEDEEKTSEEELDELMMQLYAPLDQMNMDSFWDKKSKKKRKSNKKKDDKKKNTKYKVSFEPRDDVDPENDEFTSDTEKDSEKEYEGIGGDRGGNIYVDPHYDKYAIDPFWRKGRNSYKHYPKDYKEYEKEKKKHRKKDSEDSEEEPDEEDREKSSDEKDRG